MASLWSCFSKNKGSRKNSATQSANITMVKKCMEKLKGHSAIKHEFQGKYGGHKVIVTGNFDSWSRNTIMTLDPKTGIHKACLNVDPSQTCIFKFIVDDIWQCSLDFPTEIDMHGNMNNILRANSNK